MTNYARKKDANHNAIARDLMQFGVAVHDLSRYPGCLDLLVAWRGRLVWLEVKDGEKPASRRKLTPAEQAIFDTFSAVGAPVYTVETIEQARAAVGIEVQI